MNRRGFMKFFAGSAAAAPAIANDLAGQSSAVRSYRSASMVIPGAPPSEPDRPELPWANAEQFFADRDERPDHYRAYERFEADIQALKSVSPAVKRRWVSQKYREARDNDIVHDAMHYFAPDILKSFRGRSKRRLLALFNKRVAQG